jgi:hypothetical protein
MTDAQLTKIVQVTLEQKTMLKTNDQTLENKFVKSQPPLKHPRI